MVYTASSCKTPTSARSFSHLPTRLPKNMDRRDLTTSGRFSDSDDLVYVYRISMESMTGRRDLDCEDTENPASFQCSSSDDEFSRPNSVSLLSDQHSSNDGSMHRLDFIHPLLPDEDTPLMHGSFQEEVVTTGLGVPERNGHPVLKQSRSHEPEGRGRESRGGSNGGQHTCVELEEGQSNCLTVPIPSLHGVPTRAMPVTQITPAPPNSSPGPPPRLRRARKVLTSRKSLDSGSRWFSPSLSSPDGRLGEQCAANLRVVGHPIARRSAGYAQEYEREVRLAAGYDHLICSTGGGFEITPPSGSTPTIRYPTESLSRVRKSPEVLGVLENVVYASPHHADTRNDPSLSSNHCDSAPNLTEGQLHQ